MRLTVRLRLRLASRGKWMTVKGDGEGWRMRVQGEA